MSLPSQPFRSARLEYRSPEGYESHILARASDYTAVANTFAGLLQPASQATVTAIKKYYESALLAVVVCLPAEEGKNDGQPTPIGDIVLQAPSPVFTAHHRFSTIAVGLLPEYQGKGYGSEAIEWVLEWGFQRAGLHRIGISAFEWNERAIALYKKLGFTLEGRKREAWFYEGKFRDSVDLAMLDYEWRERRDKKKLASESDLTS